MEHFIVQIWLHCLFDLSHFIGFVEHQFVEIFQIFPIDIRESKFVTGDESDFAIRQKWCCPCRSSNTCPVGDKIWIVRIYNLQIFYVSLVDFDEGK